MSDDLVKRYGQGRFHMFEMREGPFVRYIDHTDRIEELEAKLAKAVEEAEKYQHAFAAQSRKLQAVLHIDGVRTTLAELTGESHE